MNHAPGCTEQNRVGYPCFACHMEAEKEKYGDNVQFFSGDTLTVEVAEDGRLHVPNPHEESYQTLAPEYWFNKVQWDIERMPSEKKTHLSDGSHSFDELYRHRYALFIALCTKLSDIDTLIKEVSKGNDSIVESKIPWKSKKHSDGTMWDGWFIAGIGYEPGEVLTYHLPMGYWDKLEVVEIENAPEWDGHTSEDVLIRLMNI